MSRALSKDPQHRYTTCREFVESLAKATASALHAQSESQNAEFSGAPQYMDDGSSQAIKTEFCDENESADWNAPSQLLAELPASDCRIMICRPSSWPAAMHDRHLHLSWESAARRSRAVARSAVRSTINSRVAACRPFNFYC